jgi:hypothetical protein
MFKILLQNEEFFNLLLKFLFLVVAVNRKLLTDFFIKLRLCP